jgi:RimJ/RimL family protein N-acetyltransferase
MFSIERASKIDAEELYKAKLDAFSEEVKIYGFGPPGYDSLEHQIAVLNDSGVHYFKMLYDKALVGGISVRERDNKHYYLSGLYIITSFQNRGLGSEAMKFLFDEYKDADKWTLETPYLSYRNHHFYEKLGFQKVGTTEPEPDGFHLFLYEKKLVC